MMVMEKSAILPGHEQAWAEWHNAMQSGRMHHAWLLAGPKGVGKAGFAATIAREIVPTARNLAMDAYHPDIITLAPLPTSADDEKKRNEGKPYQLKRNISVDQIREMQQRLITRPTSGDRRAIIIDAADNLEQSAANALLKSLEEPPAGSYFLLVAHNPGRLLPTIRSRCRVLRFLGLDDAQVGQVLADASPDSSPEDRLGAITAARGSPGMALAFLEHDLGAIHGIMQQILRNGDDHLSLRARLGGQIGPRASRARLQAIIDLARTLLGKAAPSCPPHILPGLITAYEELGRLEQEAPAYNYDPGLLGLEIGALLVMAAGSREQGHD